jgi:hypothetical protein
VCDSHLRSAHWRDDVRGNRPDRVGCLEALARLGAADPLGGRSEMMVTALASEFADISPLGPGRLVSHNCLHVDPANVRRG